MVFRLRERRVDWRLIEGEVVALDLERSQYIAINRTGAVLWPLLAEGASAERLVSVLQERFGIDAPQAEADVEVFLADLREQDLLEADDAPA
jgi:hypothetical protein